MKKQPRRKARNNPTIKIPEQEPAPFRPEISDWRHPQRLNRILSSAGLTSRRKADEWIKAGRITVNGRVVLEPGTRALWASDDIRVDGAKIPEPASGIYLMLNKPFGYMCALFDPQGRPLVTDLLPDISERVYPVGRLDFDSLGLLLLTNDGEWAHRLTHPAYKIPRTYKVTVTGRITDTAIEKLKRGVPLDKGFMARAKATIISRNETQSILRMTIAQGKNRQIRRMLDAVGYSVIHLMRTGFGQLALGDLKVGTYRWLDPSEVALMKKSVNMI